MNHLTAAEALTRVIAGAAHGGDGDDGYTISDGDYMALGDVARWLMAGARDRGQVSTAIGLPTVNLEELRQMALAQALERYGRGYGAKIAVCEAMGIDRSTYWRWVNRSLADAK